MYLSKLTLNLRSKEARRDLGNAYEMHRTLARAFVADGQSKPARFLWRLEFGKNVNTAPVILVQAGTQPDWSFLRTLQNYTQRPVECKHVAPEKLVEGGRRYRFRLFANPTVTRQGKRYGLVGADAQMEWLKRQGERHGFEFESVGVSTSDVLNSRKDSFGIIVQQTCFDGVLRVTCAQDLCKALCDGIGPAKAFGCGLLSIAPA
jgi:CRISPR system Cascade subunit CasE